MVMTDRSVVITGTTPAPQASAAVVRTTEGDGAEADRTEVVDPAAERAGAGLDDPIASLQSRGRVDEYRTLCLAPPGDVSAAFEAVSRVAA